MERPNDPKWARYTGGHYTVGQSNPTDGNPVVGVGGFICEGCGRPHVAIAAVAGTGEEVNVSVSPAAAEALALDILARVGQLRGAAS